MKLRWLFLLCGLALILALPTPASARRTHCSSSGDLCFGAFGTGATVRLRITLFARYFTRYTLCVRGPDGRRNCRRFGMHAIEHGMYESSVRWASHFPFRGPGFYRARWNWGAGPSSPAVTFREGPSINVTPKSVRAGSTVRMFGLAGGCKRGNLVTLMSKAFSSEHEFAGIPAVYAKVVAGDRYSVRARIPSARRPGRYSVSARCGGGNFGVHAHLSVTDGTGGGPT